MLLREAEARAEELDAKADALKGDLERALAELAASRQAADGLGDALAGASEVKADLDRAMADLATSRRDADALREAADGLRAEVARARVELDAARASELSVRDELAAARRDLEVAQARADALEASQAELERARGESESAAVAAAREQLAVADERVRRVQGELEALRTEAAYDAVKRDAAAAELAATAERELANAREALDAEVARGMETDGKLLKVSAEVASARAEVDSLAGALVGRDGEIAALRASEQATEAARAQVAEELQRARLALKDAEARAHEAAAKANAQAEAAVARATAAAQAKHDAAIKEAQAAMAAAVRAKETEVATYRDMYARETALRRAVHDELMELKGNIRVFARVRPVTASEAKLAGAAARDVAEYPPESGGRDLVVRKEDDGKARFEFDAVFSPASTQASVFATVAPLVVSFLDGVNVTLFAYGQTGSGKTYTMEGTPEDPGVNGRALQRAFELAAERQSTASYTFAASVLEVYNESVFDLLAPASGGGNGGNGGGGGEALEIRMHPETKQVFVPGLSQRAVATMAEVAEVMRTAHANRSTGKTNMNEHSSRSHLVFTLSAQCKPLTTTTTTTTTSALTLIDLAGSERLDKSHATGDRLKEAQAINKSLSALGDVIQALGERGKAGGHIPFRNSKLTYLLQDQLSGSAKVGFFVNASPVEWNVQETLCSLRFAERCRKTELGSTQGDKAEAQKLRRAVDDLQQQLQASRLAAADPLGAKPAATTTPVRSTTASPAKQPASAPARGTPGV